MNQRPLAASLCLVALAFASVVSPPVLTDVPPEKSSVQEIHPLAVTPQLRPQPVPDDIPNEPEMLPVPEPEPEPQEVADTLTGTVATSSTIVMVSTDNCPPCEEWWQTRAPQLKQNGWRVERVYDDSGIVKSYPTFRVFPLRKWYTHVGNMSFGQLREIIRKDSR